MIEEQFDIDVELKLLILSEQTEKFKILYTLKNLQFEHLAQQVETRQDKHIREYTHTLSLLLELLFNCVLEPALTV